jgi:FtsH-binding integral membrane protein
MLYGSHDPWGGTSFEQKVVQALTVAVALVFLGAIAIVATAISGFAARRGLDQLRAEAQGKSAAFVVLMLVALALQAWLIPTADSTSTFGVTTVAAMAALLVATAQMARLCTHTADLLHTEPPLPKATVL